MVRLKKLTLKTLIPLFVALIVFTAKPYLPKHLQSSLFPISPSPVPTIRPYRQTSTATVKFVVDGDTVELTTGQRVRYIGIDTPEVKHPNKRGECYGNEARNENRKLIEKKTVRLEKDISEVDRYGRLLRYVYLPTESSPSGILLNDYLVREGFAFAATFPPDVKFAERFRAAQQEARTKNKGLWKICK